MKTNRNVRHWITLVAAIAALAFIGWVVFEVLSGNSSADSNAMLEERILQSNNEVTAIDAIGSDIPDSSKPFGLPDDPSVRFAPEHVLGRSDCSLRSGSAPNSELATVALPNEEKSSIAILDHTGIIASYDVPYSATHTELGKREDGLVVLGVYGRSRESSNGNSKLWLRPLSVFLDEHVTFSTSSALNFDVASDGSSFFVREDTDGLTSTLLIRNLDRSSELHTDISPVLDEMSTYSRYLSMHYSHDDSEIIINPVTIKAGEFQISKPKIIWFVKVADGTLERLEFVRYRHAIMKSSTDGYFVDQVNGSGGDVKEFRWEISRLKFSSPSSHPKVVWNRSFSTEQINGTFFLSPNQKWLALQGNLATVLDSDSGKTLFQLRVDAPIQEKLNGLDHGSPSDSAHDDIEYFSHLEFSDQKLHVVRSLGNIEACLDEVNSANRMECIDNLIEDDDFRYLADVYNMRDIQVEGQPSYSTRFKPSWSEACQRRYPRNQGLDVAQGRLVYIPESMVASFDEGKSGLGESVCEN